MSPLELIERLTAEGVTLRVDGDSLCLTPRALVPTELIGPLRDAKPALLAYLRERQDEAIRLRVAHFQRVGPPWLVVPDLPYLARVCFSCGDPLDSAVIYGRCLPCSEALWRVTIGGDSAAWPGRPR